MRIVYFADGPWAHRALERILADPRFEIACIVPRFDTRDPVLAGFAQRLNVDFLPLANVNDPASIEQLGRYDASLFVSMSYNQIFRAPLIAAAPKGLINCHAGALPFYRGRNILNWALINGAKQFGVTVHHVDQGIDTGDIILQRHAAIDDRDDYGSLLEKATALCAETLYDALDQIERGVAQRTAQASIHPVGTYFGRRREGDEWIDWSWPSRRIFDFVRGIAPPGPGARTLRGEEIVSVLAAELIEGAPDYIGRTGEVVGISGRGAVVKTGDSTLLLTRVVTGVPRPLAVGQRLGADPLILLHRLQGQVAELQARLRELEGGR
ncbi:MAG: methionyl-tRNA formyltransferase [Burkholderiaceae bacterium]|nr:methionyl-tRNA formyltransferase [Burkholderiaceae bacterium]